MKLFKIAVLTLTLLITSTSNLWAEEISKKPLSEVFDNVVVVPFDYQGKVFLNGQKTDVYGDYEIFERNGRVLVPIRLMGYLATEVDRYNEYWQVTWEPQKPDDVVLTNYKSNKTVRFKVDSKIMYIDDQPKSLDVPPQKINGRIVLPLRSTSEALNKRIEWLDGLILISNDAIDLKSPQTLEVKDKIKARLSDARKQVDYDKRVTPITRYGDTVYYVRNTYTSNKQIDELFKKTDGKQEVKIELPGEERFGNYKIINNELYYVTVINNKSELHVYNFAENKSRKLCTLELWYPDDGWLSDMKYIDNEFYIVVHSGDWTMGSEALYKMENSMLKRITGAKSFISFDKAGEYIYYADFTPMFNAADNLYRINIKTGEEENLGEKGFTYGINRTIEEQGGVSYSANSALYIKDGYIYTLGYKESDSEDKSSVYKISLDGKTQIKLTLPAREFWLIDSEIYYIDLSTGYLVRVYLEGNNKKTLVERKLMDINFFNGNIYYIADKDTGNTGSLGKLYKYNISNGLEIKLSDKLVSAFFIGKAGVYYKSEGYDLGLYKIDAKGRSACLVDDSIDIALLTDTGMVYTLIYKEGIYST